MGVGLDAGGDPHEHRLDAPGGGRERLDLAQLGRVVDDDQPCPGRERRARCRRRTCCCRARSALARHARGQREGQLALRGDVHAQALLRPAPAAPPPSPAPCTRTPPGRRRDRPRGRRGRPVPGPAAWPRRRRERGAVAGGEVAERHAADAQPAVHHQPPIRGGRSWARDRRWPSRGLAAPAPVSCPPMSNRVLVVGWDGADWEVLDPLLAGRRPAEPGGARRARQPRRRPLGAALALVGGVAVVPDRRRPLRPRRVRHPRAPARPDAADAGLVAVDPRAHLAAAALRRRPHGAAREHPPDLSADPRARRRHRRRRDPAEGGLLAPRRGRPRSSGGRSTAAPGRRSATARST